MATLKRGSLTGWKPKLVKVDVPEIEPGASVNVRTLTLADFRERAIPLLKRPGDVTAEMAVLFAVDDDGEPVFTEDDLPLLDTFPGVAIQRIALEGMRVNGLATEPDDKPAETAAKN